jgi:hypothetical protein
MMALLAARAVAAATNIDCAGNKDGDDVVREERWRLRRRRRARLRAAELGRSRGG